MSLRPPKSTPTTCTLRSAQHGLSAIDERTGRPTISPFRFIFRIISKGKPYSPYLHTSLRLPCLASCHRHQHVRKVLAIDRTQDSWLVIGGHFEHDLVFLDHP